MLPEDLIAESYEAFCSDVTYLVDMLSKSNAAHERHLTKWAAALIAREEERARELCSGCEPFDCPVKSPCGTGDCPFARGDLIQITHTKYVPGGTKPHGGAACNKSAAVAPLRTLWVRQERERIKHLRDFGTSHVAN